MNRKVFAALVLALALWTASAHAGTPVFPSGLGGGTLREMDLLLLSTQATDPAGHSLQYSWSITLDETNGQAFFRSASHISAELGVRWISESSAGQLNGRRVTIKVVASHANPADGTETAETAATFTVQGVNHPPVPVISGRLGTPTDRIPTGYGVCADGYQSSDPDGDGVRGNWDFGARSGGKWITPLGDLGPALFGSEGGRCCFTVLNMTAPIDQEIVLTLVNGLHNVKAVATCYLKPADSTTTNQPPVAKIQYMVGSSAYTNAPTTPVSVQTDSPVTVTLKGDTSTDDAGTSSLTYSWTKQDSTTGGSVSLGSTAGATAELQIGAHTRGTLTVTLTAKDQENLTGTATISFNFVDSAMKPIAQATAKVAGRALTGPVDAGAVVTLDGSASSRPDSTTTNLTYQWTQTEGPKVAITNFDKAVAEFKAPAASDRPTWLKFRLVVKDGTLTSDPAELIIDLSNLSFYFSQVAVGPLGSSEFRSCLLLVNGTSEAANGVEVDFFGQDGNPMEVDINGAPWDGQTFAIPPFSSERLVFSGDELKLGWARVRANIKLTGLLLYQVVGENNQLHTQVGLYATEAARRFATFYSPAAENAIAIANPSGKPAQLRIRIVDNKTGSEVVNKTLSVGETGGTLPSMNHAAQFLTSDFLGQLPAEFSVGTLLVESDVPVTVTILETKGGVVFSTLPVRTLR